MRNYEHIKSSLKLAHERLSGVYIFNEDFYNVVDRFDRIDTLFYCDPPYYGAERAYEKEFCGHNRLAECLRTMKGRFLLSYNDHGAVRKLYEWATIEEVRTSYTCGNNRTPSKNKDDVKELLIKNFKKSMNKTTLRNWTAFVQFCAVVCPVLRRRLHKPRNATTKLDTCAYIFGSTHDSLNLALF